MQLHCCWRLALYFMCTGAHTSCSSLACILIKSFTGFAVWYGGIACLHHADRLISNHASIMPLTRCMRSSQHPSYVPANHQQSSLFIHALSMLGHTTQTVFASLLSGSTRLCDLRAEQCSLLSLKYDSRLDQLLSMVLWLSSYVQGLVYRTEGAVGVALVNAIRGGAVSLLTGALFCSSAASSSCLNAWSACSAAVETAGGITWLTATHKVFLPDHARLHD